jgi:hypothetical protein
MKNLSRFPLAILLLAVAFVLVFAAVLPLMKKGDRAPVAWESYQKNPYSIQALEKYLHKTGNPAWWIINGRIIGGVYRANHNGKPILYIVELAPSKSGHLRTFYGTLMAFDSGGKHLKT